jgi:hypothetical protein
MLGYAKPRDASRPIPSITDGTSCVPSASRMLDFLAPRGSRQESGRHRIYGLAPSVHVTFVRPTSEFAVRWTRYTVCGKWVHIRVITIGAFQVVTEELEFRR